MMQEALGGIVEIWALMGTGFHLKTKAGNQSHEHEVNHLLWADNLIMFATS